MSSTVEGNAQPSWSVRPMSIQQVPLVVSWIAAIDPARETDQPGLADRMRRELIDASELEITEYYIGYFEQMPTFFMVGFVVAKKLPALASLLGGYVDYEISTFLISPLIEERLHLPLYRLAVQFILRRGLIDRVMYQVESKNELLKSILEKLGFRDLGPTHPRSSRNWYGCRRIDFFGRMGGSP